MTGTPHLHIRLLGDLELWRDAQLLSSGAWPDHKTCQILKLLVTLRHRVVAADELIEALWPKLDPASARNSLWVAISQLRRVLEPGLTGRGASTFILTEPPGYRFEPAEHCTMDVDEFLTQVHNGQQRQGRGELTAAIAAYEAAVILYRGDFLECDPYEEWALPTRDRLRETYLDLLRDLAICQLSLGRYQEVLTVARRALALDPCRESVWRLVMEAHYRAGEQDQALRAFARCRTVLSEELGVDPMPETIALHTHILQSPPQSPRAPLPELPRALSLHLPFVGREREWSLLSGLLQYALEGDGRIALITGAPGIGKTRMLDELAGLAAARGALILRGQCYEMEQNVAYAPIAEALRCLLPRLDAILVPCPPPVLTTLAQLLPELRELKPNLPPQNPLPPDEERARLLAALTYVIQHCTEREPVVLLLDDLQWADPSTLQAFHHLARQVHDHALLLVGAYRSTSAEAQHLLTTLQRRLAQECGREEITLAEFKADDVRLLLRVLGGESVEDALAEQLYRRTEGHPYYLTEVLRDLIQGQCVIVDTTGVWHLNTEVCTDLAASGHLPPNVRATALSRLDRLAETERLLLDQAAILGRQFPLPLLARLLSQSEDSVALQAERLCTRGFLRPCQPDRYEFGHELLRRTAYEALSEPRRRLLHRRVAEALVTLDASPDAIATHYAASDRPWLGAEHALRAAEQASRLVAYDEAVAWCMEAHRITEAYPASVPPGFRTRLHLLWRTLWYYRGDLERALAADRAALAAARREGDTTAELQALWHLAHDETQVAAGASAGWQAQALALAENLGDPAALARSLARYGSDRGFLATPAQRESALQTLDQAVSLARQAGDPALLHHVLCELWGVGRLPQARAALEEALLLVRQLGDTQEEVGTLAKLADLLARQGDFEAARDAAAQGWELAQRVDSPAYGAWNRRALGQAWLGLGDPETGLAHLRGAAQTFEALNWQAMLAGTLLRLGAALFRAGQTAEARAVLECVLHLSQATHETYESAYALAILAELQLTTGERQAGNQALEEATALIQHVGLPWHRAQTLLHLAIGRLQLGEIAVAQAHIHTALELAEAEDLRDVRAAALRLRNDIIASR